MNSAKKSLTVVLSAAITVFLLLFLVSPNPSDQPVDNPDAQQALAVVDAPLDQTTDHTTDLAAPSVADTTRQTLGNASESQSDPGKYYFDVVGHDEAQFQALLERAYMIYEQTPSAERAALQVVLVLHGPDVMFFDLRNETEHARILDLAAKLDAYGVFDFKMCTVSAQSRDISAEHLPAFVELVPYGPREISRLEEAGFMRM